MKDGEHKDIGSNSFSDESTPLGDIGTDLVGAKPKRWTITPVRLPACQAHIRSALIITVEHQTGCGSPKKQGTEPGPNELS
mmetsp:Transcript_2352/g.4093  ORF Transcript_2352/g.4093 Transcript_2352/m.4093 type:complete len:81 (+) Transcript_2352:620-862(+)